MGTYVYSLRKKHVEANLEGIYPIDVIPLEFGYKESFQYMESAGLNRLAARLCSLADKACEHYMNRARAEYGTTERTFHFAMGGLTDGTPVFAVENNLPTTMYDGTAPNGHYKAVGRLFKVGRGQWIVSTLCPKHNYEEYTTMDGTPLYQCQRCDATKEKTQ